MFKIISISAQKLVDFDYKDRYKNDILDAVYRCFECPIDMASFTTPGIALDGHAYNVPTMNTWLNANDLSPMTGLPLASRLTLSTEFTDLCCYYASLNGMRPAHKKYPKLDALLWRIQKRSYFTGRRLIGPCGYFFERVLGTVQEYWDTLRPDQLVIGHLLILSLQSIRLRLNWHLLHQNLFV